MRICFFILIASLMFSDCPAAPPAQVELVGHFSNIRVSGGEDPHQIDGYAVHLYRRGPMLFGNLSAATGALEPAQGRLFDIEFQPSTKRLHFKVKYSGGSEFNKETGPLGRDSRELLIFTGVLKQKHLIGKIVVKDGYSPEKPGLVQQVSMKKMSTVFKPTSYEEWKQYTFLDNHW
jgi:hypothetical protein